MTKPESKLKLGQRLLIKAKTFAEHIQRSEPAPLPLALEQVNARKLNRGPLYTFD
ncbi:hypothetical protein [Loigolactobacillus binensis]|uniref:Uncharacterized protein n=1 Tax=Loigolactobacillus binensis TaxID=2559922 RepID=A0ABW3EG15_9LACO|nr:hypothetical protein [Loigolactobacillus binensis]